MQNVEKYVDIKLVCDRVRANKFVTKLNFDRMTFFDENLFGVHMKRTKVFYDKPIYLGMAILD